MARLGFKAPAWPAWSYLNVQTFIAGLIIATFCVATLMNANAASQLKEVVLIVIGFYFGTRTQATDVLLASGHRPPRTDPPPPTDVRPPGRPRGSGESAAETTADYNQS